MFPERKVANLKTVAESVGLAPCSVSAILNNTKASRAIPQTTKDKVYLAASELNYRPNHWARSLRTRQTRMVGVLAPNLARSAVAQVVAAAQRRLHRHGYLLALLSSDSENGDRFSALLQQRGIEGVISVDAVVPVGMNFPVASVDIPSQSSPAEEMKEWLCALGESAAENVIRQIEIPQSPRRVSIATKIPTASFGSQATDFALASTTESA